MIEVDSKWRILLLLPLVTMVEVLKIVFLVPEQSSLVLKLLKLIFEEILCIINLAFALVHINMVHIILVHKILVHIFIKFTFFP